MSLILVVLVISLLIVSATPIKKELDENRDDDYKLLEQNDDYFEDDYNR